MILSIQQHLLQQEQQQRLDADTIRTNRKKMLYKSNLGRALYFVIITLFIRHPNVVIVLSAIVDKPLILTTRKTMVKNCGAFSGSRQRLIGAFASLHRDDQFNSKQQDNRKRQCITSSRGISSCSRNGLFPCCSLRQRIKGIPLTFTGLLSRGHTDNNEEETYNDWQLSSSDNSELILPLSLNNAENVDTSIIGEEDELKNSDDSDLMYDDATFYEEIADIDEDDDDDKDNNENARIDNLIIPDISTMLGSLQLAPASEIAYFYLQNTIGLSEESMWKITNEAGSVLGFTVKNLQHKISLLKRTMNLSDDDIRTIISKQPSILHMSANRNIGPTILFLVRALDLSKADLRSMVTQFPCILCYSIQNLRAKLKFFQEDMDYHNHKNQKHDDCESAGIDHLRKLLISEPKLLTAAVETGLKPRMKFLHKELSIPLPDLRSIINRNPRILLYSLYDNLQMKLISFFIMRLQMTPKDVLKLLKSYPLILDYNLEDHMVPIARYFVSELEYSPTELRRILLKFPRLMTHSLFKIKHVVGYLRYTLGMDATQVKRVLFQAPQVISLSTDDTLEAKVMFLRKTFALDYDDDNVERDCGDDLRKVIAGMPTLLLCSVEGNLKPKAEYLLEEFGGDAMELREAILTQPTLLGYSLEKRIRPRMKRIHDIGANPRKITVGITMKDENFKEWLISKARKIKDVRPSSPLPPSSPLLLPPSASSQHIQTEDTVDQMTYDKDGNDSTSTLVYKNISEEERRKGRIVHWKR